jgi:hypothetical protein
MPFVALLAAAAIAVAAALSSPGRVYACSAGPAFNPAAESEVIVAGRVSGAAVTGKGVVPMFVEVTLTIDVDRYLKGSGPARLEIVDGSSAIPERPLQTGADYLNADIDTLGWAGRVARAAR